MRISEVIVVEGQHDRQAVARAVDAETVATGGHALTPQLLARLQLLQQRRGLIVLTDPDYVGEQIRRRLSKAIPGIKHAYLPRRLARSNGDVGVENASPEAIREALAKLRQETAPSTLSESDAYESVPFEAMIWFKLTGVADSAARRAAVGEALGIGCGNARQFWHRINAYRVTLEELQRAVRMVEER